MLDLAMRAHAMGDTATLLECGDLSQALAAMQRLQCAKGLGELHFEECLTAAATVLVIGGIGRQPEAVLAAAKRSRNAPDESAARSTRVPESAEFVVPVRYNGEDLNDVAELSGMSVDQVIQRHTAARYTVGFTGFAPGFAYLTGGDPLLDVPRRSSPRARIPRGAVGLAGPYSGVYPRESPGGWQIIGETGIELWDSGREQPATLVPGARVRFAVTREIVQMGDRAPDPAETEVDLANTGAPVLVIQDPGLQTLIEDAGRPGYADMGVGRSGVADRGAFEDANRLVGNARGAAVLEIGLGGFEMDALDTVVLALTGAPRTGTIVSGTRARAVPAGEAFRLDAGESLRLSPAQAGVRTVLALRGGVAAQHTLGSASRDTLSGLGPAPLQRGTRIARASLDAGAVRSPTSAVRALPAAGTEITLRVTQGPRADWFGPEGLAQLTSQGWLSAPQSDRVGLRLFGDPLERLEACAGRELPSEGVMMGAIQVPANGQPVLFLVDHPVTGGYPVIAVVKEADLDLASQIPSGTRVRFVLERDADATGAAPEVRTAITETMKEASRTC